jgi:hypothetical protein
MMTEWTNKRKGKGIWRKERRRWYKRDKGKEGML